MKKIDLTEGKVIKVLAMLSIPIMGSSLLQFMYNLIDMIWVGGLGSNAVASIGSSSFFIGLGYSINSIVVIGAGIKVAHSIGAKKDIDIKRYINAGLILNGVIGLIYSFVIIVLGKEFIAFLNIDNVNVVKDSYLYLLISAGNNKISLKISAIGIIINILLDPIFIYTFKFGVLGAGIATLISNLVMFILFNIYSKEMIKFNHGEVIEYKKIIEIIKLGFPMAVQRIIFTLVNIVLARIISVFGENAIAAQKILLDPIFIYTFKFGVLGAGIATLISTLVMIILFSIYSVFGENAIAAQKIGLQIEGITYMVIGGLNGAIASFTGQNFGANKFKRLNEGYRTAIKIGAIYSILTTFIFILFSVNLVKIFIDDSETIFMASGYLKIIGIAQFFSMIEMVSNGIFTGIGKPNIPSIISIVFTCMRIPMALILIKYIGLNGIWLSIAFSSIFKGIVSFLIYRFRIYKSYESLSNEYLN